MIDKRTFSVALMLLAIFAAGGFCGWWIGSSTGLDPKTPPPQPGGRMPAAMKARLIDDLDNQFHLTSEQRSQIDNLLSDGWLQDMQRVNRDTARARHDVFEKYAPLIRTNLTSDQQKGYDRMTEQMERRWRLMMNQ